MNAIVATPNLRGWGFPVGANVSRLVRKPRPVIDRSRHVDRSSVAEADFLDWAQTLGTTPKAVDIVERFRVSRSTAYRWLDNLPAKQRRCA